MKLGIMPIVAQQSNICLPLETTNKSKSQHLPRLKQQQITFGSKDIITAIADTLPFVLGIVTMLFISSVSKKVK